MDGVNSTSKLAGQLPTRRDTRMCSQAPIQVETLGSLRCGNRKKTVPGRPGAGRGFAFPGSAATRSTARGVTLLAGPRPREYEYAESESR